MGPHEVGRRQQSNGRLNGWKNWILGIAATIIAAGVVALVDETRNTARTMSALKARMRMYQERLDLLEYNINHQRTPLSESVRGLDRNVRLLRRDIERMREALDVHLRAHHAARKNGGPVSVPQPARAPRPARPADLGG